VKPLTLESSTKPAVADQAQGRDCGADAAAEEVVAINLPAVRATVSDCDDSEFDWSDDDVVAVPEQRAIAVYFNQTS
jgi:hypothetical protein